MTTAQRGNEQKMEEPNKDKPCSLIDELTNIINIIDTYKRLNKTVEKRG